MSIFCHFYRERCAKRMQKNAVAFLDGLFHISWEIPLLKRLEHNRPFLSPLFCEETTFSHRHCAPHQKTWDASTFCCTWSKCWLEISFEVEVFFISKRMEMSHKLPTVFRIILWIILNFKEMKKYPGPGLHWKFCFSCKFCFSWRQNIHALYASVSAERAHYSTLSVYKVRGMRNISKNNL